jgi:hypothetical protein
MSHMAAPRAPKSSLLLTLALLLGAVPAMPVAEAATSPSLQVSREITASGPDIAVLTATLTPQPATPVTVNFEVLGGPGDTDGDNTPADGNCVVNPNNPDKDSCTFEVRSGSVGISNVRAWIGPTPDTAEGRLSKVSGLLVSGADCTAADGDGGFLGLGGVEECEEGTPIEGTESEPDHTDVVQIEWLNFSDYRVSCDDAKASDGADVEFNNAAVNDMTEVYTCTVTTPAGAPIQNAFIDGEIVSGTNANLRSGVADYDDLCKTDGNGRCSTPAEKISGTSGSAKTICFWAEPAKLDDPAVGANETFAAPGSPTDGGLCNAEPVDEVEKNDMADAVYLDTGNPRAEGLDVQPENLTVSGASRFSLRGTVYDQFGQPFKGNTTLQAKLFAGSVLAPNGDNSVGSLDPALKCQTNGSDGCTVSTGSQNDLGQNLACMWISTKAPTAMTGQADQDSATCTGAKAPWQAAAEQEARADASNDDGVPFPPTDGLDVVRFAVQSRPKIATVTPTDRRQNTSGDVFAVDGINFLPSAQMTISGSGVTLGPTAVVSGTRLEASLAVAPDAPPGPRDVTVTNRSDGGTVTCSGCFRVIGQGYWMVASDGGVFAFGDAQFAGSAGNLNLSKPIVAMTPTPSGLGYWMVASDGGLFNYGDAPFLGSAGNLNLSKPIVSIVATPSGRGYWLVASDGGIFAFGDARFFGSTGDIRLNKPIVAMTPTRTGRGYWLVASDGGIFAYGDATFHGSTGDIALNQPIVGMTTTPLGQGYWMVASDGGIFSFGDARFFGSTGNIRLNRPIVGLARR